MDWSKLRVVDLKEELAKLGLSTTGIKANLIARITEHLANGAQDADTLESNDIVQKSPEQAASQSPVNALKRPRSKSPGRQAEDGSSASRILIIPESKSLTSQIGNAGKTIAMTDISADPVDQNPTLIDSKHSPTINHAKINPPIDRSSNSVASPVHTANPSTGNDIDKKSPFKDDRESPNVKRMKLESLDENKIIVLVQNLTRPLREPDLRVFAQSFGGTVTDLWLDGLRSTSLIEYANSKEAIAAKVGIHGVKFPDVNKLTLVTSLVSRSEADLHRSSYKPRSSIAVGARQAAIEKHKAVFEGMLRTNPISKPTAPHAAPVTSTERNTATLEEYVIAKVDDLDYTKFALTVAKPPIYYREGVGKDAEKGLQKTSEMVE